MQYVGSELELFEHAVRWKSYVASSLAPYVRGDVLEVGAGIGGTTASLLNDDVTSWCCLEPDPELATRISAKLAAGELPSRCRVVVGTTNELPAKPTFDSVVYIDVLEHIEHDKPEIDRAAALLRPGGHLVVLCPAHQWLFSPFDAAIGHHRRHNRASLTALAPVGLSLVRTFYLDAVGVLASAGNRVLLRSGRPSVRQIALWDTAMVPLSRVVDRAIGYRLGKSVVAVWTRP
jgi:SAM-dependent methyltransferase